MKNMNLSKWFTVVLITLFGITTYGQTELSASDLTSEWQLMQEEAGIQFFVKQEYCKRPASEKKSQYSFVNLVNTTDSDVTVQFQLGVQYDEGCNGCIGNAESIKTVIVPANSSLEGDCSFENYQLSVLIKNLNHNNSREFESLKLVEFKID